MENASKALIIAGAILLAIVIISLGLIVVNNTRDITDNTNLSEQEIQNFNAKFTSYQGDSVEGSRVNSLIQQVIATNQVTAQNGSENFICIAFPSVSLANVSSGNIYMSIAYNINKGVSGTPSKKAGIAYGSPFSDMDGYPIISKRDSMMKAGGNASTTYNLSVETGKDYKVTIEYDTATGCVGGIKVKNK